MGDLCVTFSATSSASHARPAPVRAHVVSDLRPTQQCLVEQIRAGKLAVDFRVHDSDGR
jgi:hypothetical protein